MGELNLTPDEQKLLLLVIPMLGVLLVGLLVLAWYLVKGLIDALRTPRGRTRLLILGIIAGAVALTWKYVLATLLSAVALLGGLALMALLLIGLVFGAPLTWGDLLLFTFLRKSQRNKG